MRPIVGRSHDIALQFETAVAISIFNLHISVSDNVINSIEPQNRNYRNYHYRCIYRQTIRYFSVSEDSLESGHYGAVKTHYVKNLFFFVRQ